MGGHLFEMFEKKVIYPASGWKQIIYSFNKYTIYVRQFLQVCAAVQALTRCEYLWGGYKDQERAE